MFGESTKQLVVMFVIALVAIWARNRFAVIQKVTG